MRPRQPSAQTTALIPVHHLLHPTCIKSLAWIISICTITTRLPSIHNICRRVQYDQPLHSSPTARPSSYRILRTPRTASESKPTRAINYTVSTNAPAQATHASRQLALPPGPIIRKSTRPGSRSLPTFLLGIFLDPFQQGQLSRLSNSVPLTLCTTLSHPHTTGSENNISRPTEATGRSPLRRYSTAIA